LYSLLSTISKQQYNSIQISLVHYFYHERPALNNQKCVHYFLFTTVRYVNISKNETTVFITNNNTIQYKLAYTVHYIKTSKNVFNICIHYCPLYQNKQKRVHYLYSLLSTISKQQHHSIQTILLGSLLSTISKQAKTRSIFVFNYCPLYQNNNTTQYKLAYTVHYIKISKNAFKPFTSYA
jgi:hypothetical protein